MIHKNVGSPKLHNFRWGVAHHCKRSDTLDNDTICKRTWENKSLEWVHSLKLTRHLKMVVSNRNLLFQRSIFRCYVSFRECTSIYRLWQKHPWNPYIDPCSLSLSGFKFRGQQIHSGPSFPSFPWEMSWSQFSAKEKEVPKKQLSEEQTKVLLPGLARIFGWTKNVTQTLKNERFRP